MALRIVADSNIPSVEQAFGDLGTVVTLPASALNNAAVRDADLLLVRSTTPVGAPLLAGSRVRFVATATIGVDHLDTDWLAARGIASVSAPGSNASSVVQWVAAALLALDARRGLALEQRQMGIVGVGAVGSRVANLLRALGRPALLCDPPRARLEGAGFVALEEILASCTVVTVHVPLERGGADATHHLFAERRLAQLQPGALLINAARGEVIDAASLEAALTAGRISALLDVWEKEPSPLPSLIERCAIATPHIAGHSLDGKIRGTKLIYDAACAFLGVPAVWQPDALLPTPPPLTLPCEGLSDEEIARRALATVYRIEEDDSALRRIAALPALERPLAFQRYRVNYPVRREFAGRRIALTSDRPRVAAILTALGAQVEGLAPATEAVQLPRAASRSPRQ